MYVSYREKTGLMIDLFQCDKNQMDSGKCSEAKEKAREETAAGRWILADLEMPMDGFMSRLLHRIPHDAPQHSYGQWDDEIWILELDKRILPQICDSSMIIRPTDLSGFFRPQDSDLLFHRGSAGGAVRAGLLHRGKP